MISIIVPAYNRAKMLPRAINSIIKQTYSSWELIIVDDGSKDDTKSAVMPYLIDDRIKYFYKENSGAAHSRNIGVELASFKWVIFLDSDDEADVEWLSLINSAISDNCDLIFCGSEIYNFKNKRAKLSLPKFGDLFFGLPTKFTAGSFAMRKETFQQVGGYDVKLTAVQHTELGLRILNEIGFNDSRIVIIPKPLIKVYWHKEHRIRNNNENIIKGTELFLTKHKEHLSKTPKTKAFFEGIIAYNCKCLHYKKKSMLFAFYAFRSYPTLKSLLRIFYYSF